MLHQLAHRLGVNGCRPVGFPDGEQWVNLGYRCKTCGAMQRTVGMSPTMELFSMAVCFTVLILLTFVVGCRTHVQGGEKSSASSSMQSKGGATTQAAALDVTHHEASSADQRFDTTVAVASDGSVKVTRAAASVSKDGGRSELRHHTAASTQSADTESRSAASASTQPSVFTDDLVSFKGDGFTVSANRVAERFRAVWWQSLGLIALGGLLCYTKRYAVGGMMIISGFAIAAYPEIALIAFIIGVLVVLWVHRDIVMQALNAMPHALTQAQKDGVISADQAKDLSAYANEKLDNATQKLVKSLRSTKDA